MIVLGFVNLVAQTKIPLPVNLRLISGIKEMFNFFIMPTIRIDEIASEIGRYYGCNSWCNWFGNLSRKLTKWAFEVLPGNVCFAGTRISRSYSYYRRTLPFFIEQERERSRKPDLDILGVSRQIGTNEITLRLAVFNRGKSTAKDCYGRISLQYSKDDIVDVAGIPTLITRDNFAQLDGAELCWSRHNNPSTTNISYNIKQDLEIVKLVHNPQMIPTLIFPSDQGWGNTKRDDFRETVWHADKFARVSLIAKKYSLFIFVGADEVEPIVRKYTLMYNETSKEIFLELQGSSLL